MQEKNLDKEFMRRITEVSAGMNACLDFISMMQSKVLREDYEYSPFDEDERSQICDILADYLDDMDDLCIEMLQISTKLSKEGK